MSRLTNRIQKLEAGYGRLSPRVKAWLGQPLSDAERTQVECEAESEAESDLDISTLDAVTRDWLGMDEEQQ